ncbi:HORMA domain-containing protein [Lentinula novae-zelandiae]|nr:HORMA domain-containing protein [Lentinula novae-zelandiae]
MQAQANRTEAKTVSSAQSLAAIQTLLRAGLGCITFMRDLLPQDNFTESHFTSTDDSCMSQSSSNSTFSSPANVKKNVNGFKIMTMSRGYTDEADRILNYLEYGIFDALQKQYLRSFIFALYLDNNDPNNSSIVEAYTFNFQYHTIIGTDIVVPVMSLSDDMRRMSLKGKDPVAEAAKRGAIPTLRDVKRSVKTLLKTLITSMTQMDVLPKRRYATFKVFYTDDTPSDYEPPHFKAGDYEKDKWYFATHDMQEVPDNWSVGKVNAGWHEVDVNVSSIATYLPSSTEHDNQPFGGTVTRSVALVPPGLTPAGEIALRAEEIKKQIVDANSRRVVWAAEDEPKEETEETETSGVSGKGPDIVRKPIGIKNDNGEVRCLDADETFEERHYYGPSPIAPLGLKDIQRPINSTPTSDFPQTQLVNDSDVEDSNIGEDSHTNSGPRLMRRQESTVSEAFSMSTSFAGDSVLDTPTPHPTTRRCIDEVISRSSSPDSFMTPDDTHLGSRTVSIEMGVSDNESRGIEANALMEKLASSYDGGMDDIEDEEMLDLETQVVEAINPQLIEIQLPDPIQSFDSSKALPTSNRAPPPASNFIPVAHKMQVQKPKDDVVDCECGIQEEDECCSCEGGCDKWYHIWCMGYHSVQDPRLPEQFICFNCRLRADPSWELIKVRLAPVQAYMSEAVFRRALKVAEKHSPLTAVEFAQAMGCENTQARQLIKRLETEGFIAEETTTTDEIGFVQTRAKTMKGKGKSAKQSKLRRGLQKQRFVFNLKSVRCQEYKDYFDPSPEVESRLLGIPQTRASLKARNTTARNPSRPEPFPQTQSAQSQTQDDLEETFTLKRPPEVNTDSPRRKKKVKISITRGVDLAE